MLTASLLILSLAVAVLAGNHSSLRRHHLEHARSVEERGKTYTLEVKYQGNDFLDENQWSYWDGADPSGGQAKYMSRKNAVNDGIAYVQADNVAVLKVDNTNDLAIGKARHSVRITSTKTYNGGLFIADFKAMPHGCSVWPAWWSVGPNWPSGGEIDIVEGTNVLTNNQLTLHTASGSGCTLVAQSPASGSKAFTGNVVGTNCADPSNAGCGVVDPDTTSYGHGFDANGAGGVFAHRWDSNGVKAWHFKRSEIPPDITAGAPTPSTWPEPVVFWSSDNCDVGAHLYDHQLVLDISVCGWAGGTYPYSGCPGTCEQAVAHKTNFDNAKWMINYIAVYQ
ncbi:glycoside hydrolase family 16 protein [Auriscalpium vulgare]|uniref:Glycoside hydrolase family 16 protein n=1 Tax=Auriscalpium vulgare TaxID=40419 RepID=A0ACB8REA5_9AGAM|nr:glycoside hydrolase family 16 protein [Auriscalpium vulgare]